MKAGKLCLQWHCIHVLKSVGCQVVRTVGLLSSPEQLMPYSQSGIKARSCAQDIIATMTGGVSVIVAWDTSSDLK